MFWVDVRKSAWGDAGRKPHYTRFVTEMVRALFADLEAGGLKPQDGVAIIIRKVP